MEKQDILFISFRSAVITHKTSIPGPMDLDSKIVWGRAYSICIFFIKWNLPCLT